MITSQEDIKKLGTILSVWAHPDDESYLAAGVLAAAVENGQTVVCVTATKGEQGVQDEKRWPLEKLGDIRAAELKAGLDVLGVDNHHWLNCPDGGCDKVNIQEVVQKLSALIEQYKPDTILTFGPEGLTGHPDHKSVSKWTREAVKVAKAQPMVFHAVNTAESYENYFKKIDEKMNFFFNIDKPLLVEAADCDIFFTLSHNLCDKKQKALACMPSQTEQLFKSFDDKFLTGALGTETFAKAK